MSIVLTRVDSRLLHGQIVAGWLPATGAQIVVVANDEAAREPWRVALMQASVPEDVSVRVCAVDALASLLREDLQAGKRALLIFGSVADALAAWRVGVRFDALNLGNVHQHEGSQPVSPSVNLNSADLEALRTLQAAGVEIEIRAISREKSLPASQFLR